jgi:O-antigen/teichoic acid export membrane protein
MIFQGLTQATQLILGMVLVRLISKEMLGSYRQVALSYAMIAGIFSLQLESSLYYFLPKFGPERRRELLTQTLLTTGLLSVLIGVTMFLTADVFAAQFKNPQLATWIRIFALFPLADRIIQLQPAFLISLDKALYSGLYTMTSVLIMIGTVVVVFAKGGGVTGAIWAKLLVGGLSAAVGIMLMAVFSRQSRWQFNKELWFEQINYCWPLMATTIVGVMNLKVGEFLISSYFSREVYAVYSVGAIELPLIALFTSSLAAAIMPNMVAEADKGNLLGSLNLWHEASRKSSLLIFPTFAFFLVCGYDFIILLYTQDYAKAAWPFLIYLGRLPIRVAIYAAIFRALGYTRPIAVSAVIDFCVNLVVSVTLLYAGGHGFLSYIGPSIGTFFGTIASVSFLLFTLCQKMDIRFIQVMRWKELGRIFGLAILCGGLLWLIPMPFEHLLFKLVGRFVLYVLLYAAALILTKSLKPDEWELLRLPMTLAKKYIRKNS